MMVRFCRDMKASAPSLMASEMSRIFCVPVSLLSTWRARYTAKASDRQLITITNGIMTPPHPLKQT